MNLVIVESPAKAKTINKYLGDNYTVLASYGHIRDLPSKNGSVDPEQNFKMEWEVDSFSKKYLKEITDAAKDSNKIILATDPDREGEAIAWHVKEYLNEKKLLKDKEVERVVFNEITKKAVTHGIDNPRQIEPLLVDAYMARRALDYLVGFNISPILWTKLPGSKSAGRVQSVALKLITEREHEIESFDPEEFWTLSINFKDDNKNFVDAIGAGDTYLAGFISAVLLNMGDLPSMIYADVVAHISTTSLGTLNEVNKEDADEEYLKVETSLTDMEDVLYVYRTFDDD